MDKQGSDPTSSSNIYKYPFPTLTSVLTLAYCFSKILQLIKPAKINPNTLSNP